MNALAGITAGLEAISRVRVDAHIMDKEERAIRAALRPDRLVDYAWNCGVASHKLVEASETVGTALSQLWRDARVATGRCDGVEPWDHSWVVVGTRIVDITLWSYDGSVDYAHRTTVDDPRYHEFDRWEAMGNKAAMRAIVAER